MEPKVNQVHEDNRIFKEAIIGYGFEEIPQRKDGIYCNGCMAIHKRPTKMYSLNKGRDIMCRHAIIRFYNPEI